MFFSPHSSNLPAELTEMGTRCPIKDTCHPFHSASAGYAGLRMPSASGRASPAFTPPVTTLEISDHSCSGGVCQAEEPSYDGVSSPAREKHRRSLKGRERGRVYLVCAADLRRVDQIHSRQCLDICRAACFYVELMAP